MKTYICSNCESESRFKGLCRDCTTYDEDGNVLNAVRREEKGKHVHDENCGHHHHHTSLTKEAFLNARRPRLSKKQIERFNAALSEAGFDGGTVEDAREILMGGEEE